jgi:hypothetical protein
MRETLSGQWFLLQLEPLSAYQSRMHAIIGSGSGENKKVLFKGCRGKSGSLFLLDEFSIFNVAMFNVQVCSH